MSGHGIVMGDHYAMGYGIVMGEHYTSGYGIVMGEHYVNYIDNSNGWIMWVVME